MSSGSYSRQRFAVTGFAYRRREHRAEKWRPVFRKNDAKTKI
jgi:hypothetical protein